LGVSKEHLPTKLPSAQRIALLREEIRNALPVTKYLSLLHQAVVEGRIPDVDAITGKPKGTSTEVPIKDRISIAQYLVNKFLPDAKAPDTAASPLSKEDILRLSPEQLRALPAAQLAEIFGAATAIEKPEAPNV
jgi:hypothetical protein